MLARVDDAIGDVTEEEIASRLLGAMAQALRWHFPPAAPAPRKQPTSGLRERRENSWGLAIGRASSGGIADMMDIPLFETISSVRAGLPSDRRLDRRKGHRPLQEPLSLRF